MNKTFIRYDDALNLIEEGDVLLFRGKTLFSWLVEKAGKGRYSHVGLATWHNGCKKRCGHASILEITEFREWKGGRTVDFATAYYDKIVNQQVDVYRVTNPITKIEYNHQVKDIIYSKLHLDTKNVTGCLRTLTGLPYGWSRILWMMNNKFIGLRWFSNFDKMSNDEIVSDPNKIYPVCSTAVAACFSKFGFDLVPNKADEWIEPSDLSRSALLNYLFTVTS